MDTALIVIPLKHEPHGTAVFLIRNTGEIVRAKSYNRVATKNALRDDPFCLHVRSSSDGKSMMIEGSFAYFLQGHNVYTPQDLQKTVWDIAHIVCNQLRIPIPEDDEEKWRKGDILIKRIDIPASILCDHENEKPLFLKNLFACLNSIQNNIARMGDYETLYIHGPKTSWRLVIYDKKKELAAKPVKLRHLIKAAGNTVCPVRVISHVNRAVRVELKLESDFLQAKGLHKVSAWNIHTERKLLRERIGTLAIQGSYTDLDHHLMAQVTSVRYQEIMELYQLGLYEPSRYSRKTRANHRRYFLETLDIDVRIPPFLLKTAHEVQARFNPEKLLFRPRLFTRTGLLL